MHVLVCIDTEVGRVIFEQELHNSRCGITLQLQLYPYQHVYYSVRWCLCIFQGDPIHTEWRTCFRSSVRAVCLPQSSTSSTNDIRLQFTAICNSNKNFPFRYVQVVKFTHKYT